LTACKENRSTGKIVIVDTTKGDLQKLPQTIQSAFGSKGNIWPKVVISDPAMTKVYGAYSYEQLKPQDYRSIFRDARRAFNKDADAGTLAVPGKDADGKEEAADEPAEEKSDSGLLCEQKAWTNRSGTKMEAAVVAVDDIKVIFRMPNGKTVEYPLVKLSEESQEELAQLKE